MARSGGRGMRCRGGTEDRDQDAGDEHGHGRPERQPPHQPGAVPAQHPGRVAAFQQRRVVLGHRRAMRPAEFRQRPRSLPFQHGSLPLQLAGRVGPRGVIPAGHGNGNALEPVGQRRVTAIGRDSGDRRGGQAGRGGRGGRGGRSSRRHRSRLDRGKRGRVRGRLGRTLDGLGGTADGLGGHLRGAYRGSGVLCPLSPVPPAQQASRANGILIPAGRWHLHASSYANVTLRSRWPSSAPPPPADGRCRPETYPKVKQSTG